MQRGNTFPNRFSYMGEGEKMTINLFEFVGLAVVGLAIVAGLISLEEPEFFKQLIEHIRKYYHD